MDIVIYCVLGAVALLLGIGGFFAGIGGGKGVDGMGGSGVFETDLYGRAIINTTSIADQTGKDSW